MAHMIETAFYAKEPAWHGLGVVVAETKSSEEALRLAQLDWSVKTEPLFLKDGTVVEGKVANRRDDGKILGVVSEKYKIVQNREAFSFVDNLLDNQITPVKFESAGSLDGGKRVWMLAHLESKKILGDEIIPYLVFANSHDGSMAITVAMTPTRVVCQNTLTLAINNAKRSWSMKHMGDMNGKLHEATMTLRLANKYMETFESEAERLQQKRLKKTSIEEVLNIVFETTEDMTNRQKGNILDQKEQFLSIYAQALTGDLAKFKGDAWGLYNGFADYATHMAPARMTSTWKENNFSSFIDGHKLLTKAQEAIAEVCA